MADEGDKGILDFDSPYFFGASGSTTFWFMWAVLCLVPVLWVLAVKTVEPPPSAEAGTGGGELPRPDSTGTLVMENTNTKGPRKQTLVRHAAAPEGPETDGGGGGGGAQFNFSNVRTKSKRSVTPRAADVQDRAASSADSGATFHFSNRGLDE